MDFASLHRGGRGRAGVLVDGSIVRAVCHTYDLLMTAAGRVPKALCWMGQAA
jgi:hypothetical protein